MDRVASGRIARKAGGDFENLVEASFEGYFNLGVAELQRLPVPMRPSGVRGQHGEPLFRPAGVSPYDVMGFTLSAEIGMWAPATAIGLEIKSTSKHETSLSIGDQGLRAHQLAALARLARVGGIARLLWDNGGEYGVLGREEIVVADQIYHDSLTQKTPPRGSRSLSWKQFAPVTFEVIGGVLCLNWLYPKHSPRSAQSSGTPSP